MLQDIDCSCGRTTDGAQDYNCPWFLSVPDTIRGSDKGGEYLSEVFGLRIVPSLTTLKLVLDSSPEYHSHTNALIMGDPVVGEVIYKERRKNIAPLPCAKGETKMLWRLSWRDIVGDCATKQDVLQGISSVSLINIVAHGGTDRGEIALSPKIPTSCIPPEEDYH